MTPVFSSTLMGTAGGTLLTVTSIHSEDLTQTVLLAMAGAASSYLTSAFIGWLVRRCRKSRD